MCEYLEAQYQEELQRLKASHEMTAAEEEAFRLGFVTGCAAMADKVQPILSDVEIRLNDALKTTA